MGRLPFDPERIKGPPPDSPPARRDRRFRTLAESRELSVSEASELIRRTLEDRMPAPIRVIGEISNFSDRGHWYFTLKDDRAVLGCVAWETSNRTFGFTPRAGDEIVATGSIGYYGPQGRTQLYVEAMRPVGAGALELKFRRLCEELRGLGYFDPARKKRPVAVPRRIAVITSSGGAAVHDVVATARQRCPAVGILVVDTRVQGENAAPDIAHAIRWVDSHQERLGVDAMIVTRGGGSIEDLWAFNERIVADAVADATLPVVAAIGHESDTTVIELVADVRAATPTQAAMHVVPDAGELRQQIRFLVDRVEAAGRRRLERDRRRVGELRQRGAMAGHRRVAATRRRLDEHGRRLTALTPAALVARQRDHVCRVAERIGRSVTGRRADRVLVVERAERIEAALLRRLGRERDRIVAMARGLSAVDPTAVLRRGYSLTVDAKGRIVQRTEDVRAGDRIRTRVSDGSIDSVVGGSAPARKKAPKKARRPEPPPVDQMDLFGPAE